MSHFSTIKTQMVERAFVVAALRDLGYSVEEGAVAIRGFGSMRRTVDIKASKGLLGRHIGFIKGVKTFEIVADWWGWGGPSQKEFVQQVTQRYAYHAAVAKLQEQGFSLAREETQKDGRIHLVLRRMA